MPEEYMEPIIYTLIDENDQEHHFELLDRMEYRGASYYAMTPYYEKPDDLSQDDGELIVLKGEPDDSNEEILVTIEDDAEYDEVGAIFLDRIEKMFYGEDNLEQENLDEID